MIQLEGNIQIGGTDYSDEVARLIINKRRETTERRPTFGNARRTQVAGARAESVTIEFVHDIVSTSLLAELEAALDSDSGELTFSGTFKTTAVDVDNPTWSGTMIVTDLDIGGQPGEETYQTKTYPVTSAGVTKAII